MLLMATMAVMHEVHQRARRQEQPRQVLKYVRAMFRHKEEPADDGEQDEYLRHPSPYYWIARFSLLVHGASSWKEPVAVHHSDNIQSFAVRPSKL